MAWSRKRSSNTGESLDHLDRVAHVAPQFVLAVHDLHGAPAEHVGRPHHQRIADLLGLLDGLLGTLVAVRLGG